MKIEKVNVIPLRMPLEKAFPASTYDIVARCTLITEILTDEGVVGRTYLGDNRDRQKQIADLIINKLAPVIVGSDPMCSSFCWDKMFQMNIAQGSRRDMAEAMAAIDTAIWDVKGKFCSQPVYKLLGGFTNKVKPIVTGGYYVQSNGYKALIEEAVAAKAAHFAGMKIKVGGLSPTEDAKRVEAVRKEIGENFIIVVDANQGWSRDEAVEFGTEVRDCDVAWFEEPVHWYDEINGMKHVKNRTGLNVCAGQGEFSVKGCRELIEGDAVDILNFDVSVGGGVTEWIRVARMAEAFGIKMTHHEEPYISMHLLGAVKGGLYPEYFSSVRDPLTPIIVENPPVINNGHVLISEEPGFGLTLNDETIQKYRVD